MDNDDDICRTCGEEYADGGDGFDGECPSCADKTAIEEGEIPYPCPDCGEEKWVAYYRAEVKQPVHEVRKAGSGRWDLEYTEAGQITEEGPTEQVICANCGYQLEGELFE